MKKKIPLIVVCGPTASGKTALAVELAKIYNGEVVSADSMQIYKGMSIATAKPTKEEMQGIAHHLIDFVEPEVKFSVADFLPVARECIKDIYNRKKQPIVCGGTGLYIDAVVRDYQLSNAPVDEDFRKSIAACSDEELTERLASFIRLHNHTDTETRERLVRALEIQTYRASHPEDCQHLPDV
ncbi:MAG: tRNA (adenosine(37)-N6)-dimethylallyltransferase MiaA, partial [Ruminococcus sp.]|nr:tRNA (adenosine(37)-N6)-dimethylallyltransferase MiaA [Ruminococcus sp.]